MLKHSEQHLVFVGHKHPSLSSMMFLPTESVDVFDDAPKFGHRYPLYITHYSADFLRHFLLMCHLTDDHARRLLCRLQILALEGELGTVKPLGRRAWWNVLGLRPTVFLL